MKMIDGGLKLLLCAIVAMALGSGKEKSAFKLILLPDTQTYSSNYPEIFRSQTRWCAENSGDIAFVLQQGDITDNNSEQQWTVASDALSRMDGKVPYTFVPGNHDIGEGGRAEERDTELLNRFMPYEKYSRMSNFGGAFSKGKMDNTFHTFKAGGLNWLILSLEFGVRDTVLAWAATVVEKHPRHKVIINTHAYMYSDDTRMSKERDHKWLPQTYGLGKSAGSEAVNSGEQIWDKLVKNYENILFVFSGHVLNDGAGVLVSEGIHGNKVYQMLANFQGGVEGTQNGGDGFLRILTIDPENAAISVKTYSPHVYKYKTDPSHQFTFKDVNF
jgi:hypothetical protein